MFIDFVTHEDNSSTGLQTLREVLAKVKADKENSQEINNDGRTSQ